jgi:diguanylate cyclase (GGDEF)-like protein
LRQVTLWRVADDEIDGRRWLPVAHQSRSDLVMLDDDALLRPHEELKPFEQMPVHAQALESGRAGHAVDPAGEHLCVMPLPDDPEGVIELRSSLPIDATQENLVFWVLRIVHNFQTLLDDSERDTLTGLLNRKTFDEAFMKAVFHGQPPGVVTSNDRRQRGRQAYWLGVVDLDHFKLVNDRYGHLIGDEVLVLMARILRSSFRYQDRAYRFGGEEFVILLMALDQDSAYGAFERMRTNLAAFAFPQVGQVTASIGFCEVRQGDTPQIAFDRADRATYYAKQHGRNQVQCFDQLEARGELSLQAVVGDIELF